MDHLTLFLLFGIMFPTETLIVAWVAGFIPENSTPFIFDLIMLLIGPRILIAWWCFDLGLNDWAFLYLASHLFLDSGIIVKPKPPEAQK